MAFQLSSVYSVEQEGRESSMFPCHSADIKGNQVPISDLQKVGAGHDYLVGSKLDLGFHRGKVSEFC